MSATLVLIPWYFLPCPENEPVHKKVSLGPDLKAKSTDDRAGLRPHGVNVTIVL